MISAIIKFINTILNKDKMACYDEVDARTFGAEAVFGLALKSDLTEEDFTTVFITQPWINQGSTDFCVGTGKAYFKTVTEMINMSWAGAFAMGARSMGYVPKWGISILQVMKGAVKYGVPEERLWKFQEWNGTKKSGRAYFADWRNMPSEVLANSEDHKDESFVVIYAQPGMDRFDQFRSYLKKFSKQGKPIVIQTGVDAHNVTIIGQKKMDGEMKIFGPDSYGIRSINYRVGKSINGFRYFSRSEANQLFNGYIALDIPRAVTELLHKYNGLAIKASDGEDCYLVKEGMKRLLRNETVAWSHGIYFSVDVDIFTLPKHEFDLIPVGNPMAFQNGPLKPIVIRIAEKIIAKKPATVDELINED